MYATQLIRQWFN